MLNVYREGDGLLRLLDADSSRLEDGVWIDMVQPTQAEEAAVEALLGMDVPTPEEMREVESSSQLYREGSATIMTIRVLSVSEQPSPLLIAVTFILTPERLVTLRYADPPPFRAFVTRAAKELGCARRASVVMAGLLEATVAMLADILEAIGDELDKISTNLFTRNTEISQGVASTDLQALLTAIGRNGDLASRTRDSLHSISRVMPILEHEKLDDPTQAQTERLDTLNQDIKSLLDLATYLSSKIQFLLDSALGLINIQQNAIIKIFSVAAVIFLPPTLIASIYGMNFEHIPELKWHMGYPYALAMMVLSAIVPYWYFKRRRWL